MLQTLRKTCLFAHASQHREKQQLPDSRGQVILSAIINEHFVTGEPVGSKILAEKFANARV